VLDKIIKKIMSNKRISKEKLLSLYKQNLQEMAMDFQTPDRPERGLQQKLAAGDTTHKHIPYPETGNPNQNFQELLASDRYRQVVAKLREYVPNAPTLSPSGDPRGMMPLMMLMMQAHNNIVQIERNSREQLEALAVELVTKEMGIPEGSLQFDVKIVGMGEIDTDDFNKPQDNQNQPEGGDEEGGEQEPPEADEDFEIEEDLFGNLQGLDLEKAKRRMINSVIQGASKRGHYMYNYVAERIQQITGSQTLIAQYGILMSINDTLYWQVSDDTMKAAMGGGEGDLVGGKESIDVQTDPPTIIARGVNFPILVHEIIKGIMELFGTRGRNAEKYQEVEAEEDTMEQEIWDLRLGPAIWDRLRSQFPEEIVIDENKVELQNYLLTEIFELPPKKFFVFFKEVLTQTERGKRLMDILMDNVNRIFNDINNQVEQEDFDEALEEATEQVNDEDLMNFLTSLGIKLDRKDKFGPNATEFDPDQGN
jgi:hypothetical protein